MNDRLFLKQQKKQIQYKRKNSERRLNDISGLSNRFKKQMNAYNISIISKYRDISGKKKSKSKSKKKEPIIPSYNYREMPKPQRKRSEMNEKKMNKKNMINKINNKSGLINVNFNYNKRPKPKNIKNVDIEKMIDKFLGKYDLGNFENKNERKKKSEYVADNFFEVEKKGKIKFKNNENDNINIDIDKDINNKLDKDIDKLNDINIKDTLDLIFLQ